MLSPSQRRAADALQASLELAAVAQLQGLSGSGKSLIARQVLDGREGVVIESKNVHASLGKIKDAIGRSVRVVILSQAGTDTQDVADQIGVARQVVTARGLTAEETEAWLDRLEPSPSPEEREHVLHYSLGIPLLIERLCGHRPVTRASAVTQCTVYLQGLIEECHVAGDDRGGQLRAILAEYTDFALPDDVVPRLADWEWRRHASTPMTILHSRLLPGAELPTPASLQIFELYAEWLRNHPDEPSLDVFVPDAGDAEALLRAIGYCEQPDRAATLKRFVFADARKGATFYARHDGAFCRKMDNATTDSDSHLYPIILRLARASGMRATLGTKEVFGRETCVLQMEDAQKALFLHKHDHTPRDVMPVAYTVECALQQLGIPYMVQYNEKPLRYDPEKHCYEPVEAARVDFFRERYGDARDEEGE